MAATRGAGVTAAAGTSLSHHLFAKIFTRGKSPCNTWALGIPYHTFVHCKGFAPAAPRRARVSLSTLLGATSLKAPTDLRLGEPLPLQQPNQPPTHP